MASIGQTGRAMKMAFAKHGTNSWGVAASVTKGIYFESDGGWRHQPAMLTDDAFNQSYLGPADPGLVDALTLQLTGRDRYEDYQYILEACAMGSPAAVAISTSATGQVTSWTHQVDLADSIDGLGVTIAIDKNQFVEELTSAKVHGFTLSQADNGAMSQTFNVLGNQLTNISSVNINSTLAGASFPGLTGRIMQQQGVFRMNLNSAGALGATDAVKCESIKFGFVRPQDAPHVYGQQGVDEPADNGWPEPTLEITFPRMNTVTANSMFATFRSATALKADWTFTGALINSTDAYKKLYQWPYLQHLSDGFIAATSGAQQVKPVVKFAARLAPTSPTGMAFVRPFRLTRIMVNSVFALT